MNNLIENIPVGDNLLLSLGRQIVMTEFKVVNDQKGKSRKTMLVGLFIGALFLVSATEPFKLVMRRNIGLKAFSFAGVVIAAIFYLAYTLVIAALLSSFDFGAKDDSHFFLQPAILIPGIIFYISFAVYLIVRGFNEYLQGGKAAKSDYRKSLHRGESVILGHLSSEGWAQDNIWRNAEPKACAKVCIAIFIINPIIGAPLLLTSLSFAFNEWYHLKLKGILLAQKYGRIEYEAALADTYTNSAAQNKYDSNSVS